MAPRDSQKAKVYAGERECFGETTYKPMSIAQCQEYVDEITRSVWWRRRCRVEKISVSAGRGGGRAYYDEINLGPWARQHWVILHELAHVMTSSGTAGHGREYCANYVALTRHVLGKDQGDRLLRCLRASGAKVRGENKPKSLRRTSCVNRCGKHVPPNGGWKWGDLSNSAQFCTKRCATEWALARITKA